MSYRGNDDPLYRLLGAISMLRQAAGGGPESQISTREDVNIVTRFQLAALNALALFMAFCLFMAGLYLTSSGIAWLLDLNMDPASYLLAWLVILLVAIGVNAGIRRLFQSAIRPVQSFAVVVALIVVGLALGSFALTVREHYDPVRLAGMVVGAGMMVAAPVWFYNQAMDLVQPYWRRSPYEDAIQREIFPAIRALLGMDKEEEQAREVDPRFPFQQWSQPAYAPQPLMHRPGWTDTYVPGEEVLYDEEQEKWQELLGDEEEEEEPTVITAEAGNLVWFALYAARCRSLTHADLLIKPAPTLPFKEKDRRGRERELRLRKKVLRILLARGSTRETVSVDGQQVRGLGKNGWWHLRGQGAPPEWARRKGENLGQCKGRVVQEAVSMWESVMDDLPVPDYWDARQYENRKAA